MKRIIYTSTGLGRVVEAESEEELREEMFEVARELRSALDY